MGIKNYVSWRFFSHAHTRVQVYHAMNGKLIVQAQRSIDEYAKTRAAVGVDAKVPHFWGVLGRQMLYQR